MNQPEKTRQPWIKQTSLASKQGITHTPMNTLWFIWLMALRFLSKTFSKLWMSLVELNWRWIFVVGIEHKYFICHCWFYLLHDSLGNAIAGVAFCGGGGGVTGVGHGESCDRSFCMSIIVIFYIYMYIYIYIYFVTNSVLPSCIYD